MVAAKLLETRKYYKAIIQHQGPTLSRAYFDFLRQSGWRNHLPLPVLRLDHTIVTVEQLWKKG